MAMQVNQSAVTALPRELEEKVRALLAAVPDPEIPVLSVVDLGVIRELRVRPDGTIEVAVSPTYSGCPATPMIKADIVRALEAAGLPAAAVDQLSPPWTSDWISDAGRQKLRDYGIAPPAAAVSSPRQLLQHDLIIACPHCGSTETRLSSEFGSTPCKALYRCDACLEPFEYFKCI
jgi:ring-1,2-phenylacetyl-CoA epoxidase subunit PaaD